MGTSGDALATDRAVVEALRLQVEATAHLAELTHQEQLCLLQGRGDRLERISEGKRGWLGQLAAGRRDLHEALQPAVGPGDGDPVEDALQRLPEPARAEAQKLHRSLQSGALRLARLSRTNLMLLGYGIAVARRVSAALCGTTPERSAYDARGAPEALPTPEAGLLRQQA